MTDHMKALSAELKIKGDLEASLTVTRGAESWQFFAFVFAALVSLAFTLADEIPDRHQTYRVLAKVVSFVGLGYLLLINARVRNWLAGLLTTFKRERR